MSLWRMIPKIDYKEFKELEGKLNAYMLMCFNDEKLITISELLDFIQSQNLTEREKIHLGISATITMHRAQLEMFFK